MLEVVFSDSAKGLMKMAKRSLNQGSSVSKYIEEAGCNACWDVAYIGFSLDIGDITHPVDGEERRDLFRQIWSESSREVERFFQGQREDIEKLISGAKAGIPIRVWGSNVPYSQCGFAFVCDLSREVDCPISIVSLPEYREVDKRSINFYEDWSGVNPDEISSFLSLERAISPLEKRVQSNHWKELQRENSMLRAVVNGQLISVDDDFYDHIILRHMPRRNSIWLNL